MVVGQTGEYVDVVVLGGGPGGYSAAIRAAQLGRSVVLVEQDRVGGVCLNEGCIPSKALLSASALYSRIRAASAMGIDSEARVDFGRLSSWKDGVVRRLSTGVEHLLKRYGVEVKIGTAHFASDHRVAVEHESDFEFVDFGGAVVATGSRALPLDGIAFDGVSVLTPEGALALRQLPARVAIAGGGYIGLEIATAYSRLGASVTVVHSGERPFPELDQPIAQAVVRGLRALGVELLNGARVEGIGDGLVRIAGSDGAKREIPSDTLVIAAERAPNTEGLGLDRTSVHLDEHGYIAIDARCRTSARSIYAVGDVTQGPLLAHRAIAQARVAAEALAGLSSGYDVSAIPRVYFTEPEVMSVGLTEEDARAQGVQAVSARFPFGASGRAATLDDQQGSLQVVAERSSGRVLGIHGAGNGVAELAGEATLAIELGATLDDLSLTVHPHPSLSEAIPEAAWLALDAPLHVFRGH
jgi:dihydrolipoamide dehydrogenase